MPTPFYSFSFLNLGEYRLWVVPDRELNPHCRNKLAFNCSIRNGDELATERIELHLGEELVTEIDGNEVPLIKINENGAWAYMPQQSLWWPLRNHAPQLGLDRQGHVRVKWNE